MGRGGAVEERFAVRGQYNPGPCCLPGIKSFHWPNFAQLDSQQFVLSDGVQPVSECSQNPVLCAEAPLTLTVCCLHRAENPKGSQLDEVGEFIPVMFRHHDPQGSDVPPSELADPNKVLWPFLRRGSGSACIVTYGLLFSSNCVPP